MRLTFTIVAAAVGMVGALVTVGSASADEESATEVITRLQSQGYKVNVDKIGSAPIDQCVVTSVRNPQQFSQLVPYTGPTIGDGRILVPRVTSQTVNVSVTCPR